MGNVSNGKSIYPSALVDGLIQNCGIGQTTIRETRLTQSKRKNRIFCVARRKYRLTHFSYGTLHPCIGTLSHTNNKVVKSKVKWIVVLPVQNNGVVLCMERATRRGGRKIKEAATIEKMKCQFEVFSTAEKTFLFDFGVVRDQHNG